MKIVKLHYHLALIMFFILFCFCLSINGCAFHKNAVITSEPDAAKVYIDGEYAGETPLPVTFTMNNEHFTVMEPVESPRQIKVTADGYKPLVKVYDKIDRKKPLPKHKSHFVLQKSEKTSRITTITEKHNMSQELISKPSRNELIRNSAAKYCGEKWAVIIGISKYKDTQIPSLRYASDDANSFYNWAVEPNGGKYSPSRVKLLLNRDATYANIKASLFVWLKQALKEDMITIYFAGHGSPESPDSPENLFLLPYDTNYQSISTSAFPMWDIETALKRYIKAQKVVVIADACHAGGVGQSFDIARRANRGIKVNPISSGIQNLSQVGDGVCVISASSDKQFSQESQKWGGGHGVFTYFLLKGLQGDADYNNDAKVTLGELTSYLSEQVRRETKNAQSPTVAGRYDPALTIGK